jgi:Uma2 family endonuclease
LSSCNPQGALRGVVTARIGRLLANHVHEHELGEVFGAATGFELASDPDTVPAPDASFVARERIAATGIPTACWPEPPDLAFEPVSPGDRRATRARGDGSRATLLLCSAMA